MLAVIFVPRVKSEDVVNSRAASQLLFERAEFG
jgi:hypothetical protein